MISSALRTDIELWASRKDTNPVIQLARRGRFTSDLVATYIANINHLIRFTPAHLEAAISGARRLGDEKLARHYEHKLEEELGHSVWGDNDLESLRSMSTTPPDVRIAAPIEALAKFLSDAIAEDPSAYLCHLAFTEYVTALLGPEFLSLIEERCGVPRTAMTVIDKHIELDIGHSEEGFDVIDDLVADPRKTGPLRRVLGTIAAHFDAFFFEMTLDSLRLESQTQLSAAFDESEPHVSAA